MINIGDVIAIPNTDGSHFIVGVVERYSRYGNIPTVVIRFQGNDGTHVTTPMPNNARTEEFVVKS